MRTIERRAQLLTLGAVCLALFLAMLDNTVVTVALPRIQGDLSFGVAGLQWILSGYTLALAALLLSGGTLGDVYGRKRLLLAGTAVFVTGSLVCALAGNLSTLIGGRVVQGAGAAALVPATLAVLSARFPDPGERARAVGVWSGVSLLALALGPVVGGLLVDAGGWRSIFWFNVAFGALAGALVLCVVEESVDPVRTALDLPGQVLAVVALGAATYATIEGHDRGWTSVLIVVLYAVAALSAAAFLAVEARAASPMVAPALWRHPTFVAANAVTFAVSFALFAIFFFLSLYLQLVRGAGPTGTALRFVPMTVALILAAVLSGRLTARVGPRLPMTVGLVLAGAGMLVLLRTLGTSANYGSFAWVLPLVGVGLGLATTPTTAAVLASAPPERAGLASATASTMREVGGVFGVALLGAVVTSTLTSELTTRLTALGIGQDLQQTVIDTVTHGGTASRQASSFPVIVAAAKEAFVTGLHDALAGSAIVLFVGAVIAAVAVRPGSPPARPTDGGGGPRRFDRVAMESASGE